MITEARYIMNQLPCPRTDQDWGKCQRKTQPWNSNSTVGGNGNLLSLSFTPASLMACVRASTDLGKGEEGKEYSTGASMTQILHIFSKMYGGNLGIWRASNTNHDGEICTKSAQAVDRYYFLVSCPATLVILFAPAVLSAQTGNRRSRSTRSVLITVAPESQLTGIGSK